MRSALRRRTRRPPAWPLKALLKLPRRVGVHLTDVLGTSRSVADETGARLDALTPH